MSEETEKTGTTKKAKPKPIWIALIALGVVIAALLVALIIVIADNSKLRRAKVSADAQQGGQETASRGDGEDSGNVGSAQDGGSDKDAADQNTGSSSEKDAADQNTDSSSDKDGADQNTDSADSDTGTADQDTGSGSGQDTDAGASEGDGQPADGYLITFSDNGTWASGNVTMCSMEMSITNNTQTAVSGWTLVLEIKGLASADGWNGTFSVSGDTLTIKDAGYNGEIAPGSAVYTGCNLGAATAPTITSATLNGIPCTVKQGIVNQDDQNRGGQGDGQDTSVDVAAILERSEQAVQGDDWLHTDGNRILDKDGKQVWLTGVNWFGYNTGTNTFDGLWNSKLEPTVKAIADHGFNLIRVPISAQLINQWAAGEYPRANYNNAYNPVLNGMNSLQIFDYFLTLAEGCGLKVMPDIHSAETDASGHNVNLWCTSRVSVEQYYAALEWLAERYKDNDTIIAIDLKNEPHGKPNEGKNAAIWNDSRDANNWKYVAETAAAKVLAKNPNLLILVEGTEIYPKNNKGDYSSTNEEDYYFNWWGGNLRAVRDFPINLGKYQNKLVYSPHDYGPTVYEQPWFKGTYTYESLMHDCWKDNWLYIQEENIAPLLIGEWGGFMREPNLTWMTYMRRLIKNYHLNHTFWCLNANSGDTGGLLLDDFTTWDQEKYAFVKEVLWQENGKFVGLDHAIPLGANGMTLTQSKGLR